MENPESVIFKTSPRKEKKLRAIFTLKNGNKKNVDFGATGYKDFTIYSKLEGKEKAKEKRKAYLARHRENEDWSDPMTAGALSRWILWEKPNLRSAINSFKKRFNLQ